MADARALLKARRQEARVSHPYANYTASGQLRCIVCGISVKQASMWEGHVGSKAHRVNVIKMREEEARKRTQEEEEGAESDVEEEVDAQDSLQRSPPTGKRKAREAVDEKSKRRRIGEEKQEPQKPAGSSDTRTTPGGFPADFFSDPSRAPISAGADDDEEQEEQLLVC